MNEEQIFRLSLKLNLNQRLVIDNMSQKLKIFYLGLDLIKCLKILKKLQGIKKRPIPLTIDFNV